ncbi:MAG: hypothetical protein CK544_05860 [Planctomycetaceae bacterium]|nr:MAG: hypothetical protein CK544_05860 [Planctomycetaceae bacterium]
MNANRVPRPPTPKKLVPPAPPLSPPPPPPPAPPAPPPPPKPSPPPPPGPNPPNPSAPPSPSPVPSPSAPANGSSFMVGADGASEDAISGLCGASPPVAAVAVSASPESSGSTDNSIIASPGRGAPARSMLVTASHTRRTP